MILDNLVFGSTLKFHKISQIMELEFSTLSSAF